MSTYGPYMEDLKELEHRGIFPSSQEIPPILAGVSSPLRVGQWVSPTPGQGIQLLCFKRNM